MKGFIEIETKECGKMLVAVSQIRCVHNGEKCRTIHFVCEENMGFKTDESYDAICNKIRDALSEEQNGTEDAWAIMNLLFKAMREKGNAKATQEQATESTWVMMGGFPACEKCGCSPADWEDGFPPYCHSCGARMTNGNGSVLNAAS